MSSNESCGNRALFPPFLVACIEDEDEEREEEENVADQEGCMDGSAPSGAEAFKHRMKGGVGGGIDWHVFSYG